MAGSAPARGVIRLGVLGDPLAFTLSPVLHRAGLEAVGLAGESVALRTSRAELAERLRELARGSFLGVNLTHPLKDLALESVERASEAARRARSVNTIRFDPGGPRGETTDGPGFVDLLRSLGRAPERERVILLGAGGAARSLALALGEAGAAVTLSARSAPDPRGAAPRVAWRSPEEAGALAAATVIVNATPLGAGEDPVPLALLPRQALIVDLVYEQEVTAWVARARAAGLTAWDGLGLLVHQARRSLEFWLDRPVPVEPLARAVGWPR